MPRQSLPVSVLAALAVAGCGQSGLTPTLSGGVSAPEGAGDVLTEFVQVCSAIVLEGKQASAVLAQNDWDMPSGSDLQTMAMLGGMVAEKPAYGMSVQVLPIDFPHLKGQNCTFNVFDEFVRGEFEIAGLDGIEGFTGSVRKISGSGDEANEIGRWSAVSPDGDVVTIYAMSVSDPGYANMSMNKSKPVQPAQSETQ